MVITLWILVSVAAGIAVGHCLTRTSPTSPAPVTLLEAESLVDSINALRAELSRPHEALASPLVTTGRTEAAPETGDSQADIARQVREATAELVQALGQWQTSLRQSRSEMPPPVFPNGRTDTAAVTAATRRTAEENNKTYLFWTYQQVIDAFGVPKGTGRDKDGAILWWYLGDVENTGLNFWFVDGRVFRVEAES